jgi:two-component system sensor kinase FixL
MSWTTIAWSMIASACLTLALIHLLIWLRQRRQWSHLLFSVTAISAGAMGTCELWMMHAQTAERYAAIQRWTHVPVFLLTVSLVWFARLYFRAGRTWLAWAVSGVRGLALALNFLSPESLNFTVITGLRRVAWFGGGTVSVAEGVINPLTRTGELSSLVLVIFIVDAALALWRRGDEGDRRRAVVIGGSISAFVLLAAGHTALVHAGLVRSPYLISVAYLAIVLAMSFELGSDVLGAAQLTRRLQARDAELRASEERIRLAADAAQLGIWVWDVIRDRVWATDKVHILLGFPPGEAIKLSSFLARVHPEDREPVQRALESSLEKQTDYAVEHRVLLPDGGLRWIAAQGRVEDPGSGEGKRMLGVCMDITRRRQAEEAAHHLSARLIHAQEGERKRLARELHDELGQGLALLSVEIELLGRGPPLDPEQINGRVQALSARVKNLSSDVHRLSHELHPAKLEQLGLAAAVRGLCRELATAHAIAIDFEQHEVPGSLPDELALCLYRIAQEALRNVVKHSAATTARVTLGVEGDEICLAVTDNGRGFDPRPMQPQASLGLVSMQERARLAHGRISVQSSPGGGTRVEVRVSLPLVSAPESGLAG